MGKELSSEQYEELLRTLQNRFHNNMVRHQGLGWAHIERRLKSMPQKLYSLCQMEQTGGEPDVIGEEAGEYLFADCAVQSPAGRRNLCYDHAALEARKANKPGGSAVETAAAMGIELLTEAQYQKLQSLGDFDTKTSSWISTPPDIRKRGGALFCDRRYNHVFVYHNGAESYYSVRGFRGLLKV